MNPGAVCHKRLTPLSNQHAGSGARGQVTAWSGSTSESTGDLTAELGCRPGPLGWPFCRRLLRVGAVGGEGEIHTELKSGKVQVHSISTFHYISTFGLT